MRIRRGFPELDKISAKLSIPSRSHLPLSGFSHGDVLFVMSGVGFEPKACHGFRKFPLLPFLLRLQIFSSMFVASFSCNQFWQIKTEQGMLAIYTLMNPRARKNLSSLMRISQSEAK